MGLSGFGAPGSANRVRTLSIEAIKELQILIAPFDVRYGNFAGGLVNALTRSGSNQWEGSISGYFQDEGSDREGSELGNRAADFSAGEVTLTLGWSDRAEPRRFLSRCRPPAIWQGTRRISIGTDTTNGRDSLGTGVRLEDHERFQDIPQEHLPCGSWRDRVGACLAIRAGMSSPRLPCGRP